MIARGMIASQTSVIVMGAKMTLRRNENHFNTWKALNHFGIRSDSFKLLAFKLQKPRAKKMSKMVDEQSVKEL